MLSDFLAASKQALSGKLEVEISVSNPRDKFKAIYFSKTNNILKKTEISET